MKFTKDSYIIYLDCTIEGVTPMIVTLNPYEYNFIKYLENLSNKLANDDSQPQLYIKQFPYKEYYGNKLSSYEREELKEIIEANRKAYNKIKKEIKKQIKASKSNNNEME